MGLDKLKLTLDPSGDNYQYMIYPIDDVQDKQKKDGLSIALPGQSYKENIWLGISGQSATIEITFWIHDDGTDKANGSYTSAIKTVDDQIMYLKDVMHAPSFTASWQLNDESGDTYSSLDVFLQNIDVTTNASDAPKWRKARLELGVGESI